MPFAFLHIPSIALTQLKAVTDMRHGKDVSTRIHYLNMDFSRFFGINNYSVISERAGSRNCNYGEWYFRQAAFPDSPDNTPEFLNHFDIGPDSLFQPAKSNSFGWSIGSREFAFYANALAEKRDELLPFMQELIVQHELDRADIVGLTSLFQQNVPCLALARMIREINPGALIIMGGANCESPMGQEILRNFDVIDYVFSGSALISFPDFVGAVQKGKSEDCRKINGVFCRENLGRIESGFHETNSHDSIRQLGNELPVDFQMYLDYDSYLDEFEKLKPFTSRPPVLLFETSRGCWWGEKAHCTFCGLNGQTMAYRPLQNDRAIRMFTDLFRRYGDRVKHFSGIDNIMPREFLETVFPFLEVPDDISIFYEIKADLDSGELKRLRETSISSVQPGIESLHSPILKMIKKGATAEGNIAFLRNSTFHGIQSYWNILIGFPGETEESYLTYQKNIPSLWHIAPPKDLYIVRFDRYSPYYDFAEKFGLNLKPLSHYYFLYPNLNEGQLLRLACFFEDPRPEASHNTLVAKWFTEINTLVKNWEARYYGTDGISPARLYFERNGIVVDTRKGKKVIHRLSKLQSSLLEFLFIPATADKMRRKFETIQEDEFESAFRGLRSKRLIYSEDEKRFVSLVISGETESPDGEQEKIFYELLGGKKETAGSVPAVT